MMEWFDGLAPDSMLRQLMSYAPRAFTALLSLVIFWVVWRLIRRTIRFVTHRAELDQTLSRFIETVTQYVLMTIAVLTALSQLGVNVTAALTSLGVVGLTIGFAAKDALSNLISGLFILWDRPFVIGDLIEINGQYGRVDNITLRSTRVVTVDGKMLAIPNTSVVNSTVASYTNFPHLRIDVPVTVGVDEDLSIIRGHFQEVLKASQGFIDHPPPRMVVSALNDYNIELIFQAWIEDERTHIQVRFDLREALFERFRSEGVDMPYQTIQSIALKPKEVAA